MLEEEIINLKTGLDKCGVSSVCGGFFSMFLPFFNFLPSPFFLVCSFFPKCSFTTDSFFNWFFFLAGFAQADFELDKAGAAPSLCSYAGRRAGSWLPGTRFGYVGAGGLWRELGRLFLLPCPGKVDTGSLSFQTALGTGKPLLD